MLKEEVWKAAEKEMDEMFDRLSAKFGKAFDDLDLDKKVEIAFRYFMQCRMVVNKSARR